MNLQIRPAMVQCKHNVFETGWRGKTYQRTSAAPQVKPPPMASISTNWPG